MPQEDRIQAVPGFTVVWLASLSDLRARFPEFNQITLCGVYNVPSRTMYIPVIRGPEDASRIYYLGHEVLHHIAGDWHSDGPVGLGCD